MARFSHLPIFIKLYDFAKLIYALTAQFRKEYKHTLGADLQKIIWEVIDEVIIANSLPNNLKKENVAKMSRLFDMFKIRFRLAYEIGLMTDKKFAFAQKSIEEIGNMIGGWQKWCGG